MLMDQTKERNKLFYTILTSLPQHNVSNQNKMKSTLNPTTD